MDKDCALVLSFSEMESSSLIKEILQCDELPQAQPVCAGINAYSYLIDNKYYTNEIFFCTKKDDAKLDHEFVNNIHAIIIHYDPENEDSFSQVKEWIPFAERQCPDIRLLLCSSCNENSKPPKSRIRQWCAEQKFCLFELKPDEDSDDDEDCAEPSPIEGILRTLQAYLWPNSKLKDAAQPQVFADGMQSYDRNLAKCIEKLNNSTPEGAELDTEGYEDEQSFESLFEQFATMKEKAQTLSGDERKDYAEEVVKLFWNSLGGGEEELANI